MPSNSEVVLKIEEVETAFNLSQETGSLTLAAWKESLSDKRRGRAPGDYTVLQSAIDKVAKNGLKKWTENFVANLAYEDLLRNNTPKVPKPAHIKNLLVKGVLKMPVKPVEVPAVEKKV